MSKAKPDLSRYTTAQIKAALRRLKRRKAARRTGNPRPRAGDGEGR